MIPAKPCGSLSKLAVVVAAEICRGGGRRRSEDAGAAAAEDGSGRGIPSIREAIDDENGAVEVAAWLKLAECSFGGPGIMSRKRRSLM